MEFSKEEKQKFTKVEQLANQKNGITLVALVVTIVVLLILASVTITYVLGDNSIIKKAQEAKIEIRAGSVQEEADMWRGLKSTKEYLNNPQIESLEQLLERLVSTGQLTKKEKAEVEETGQVTIGTKTIIFGKQAKTLVNAFQNRRNTSGRLFRI